MSRNFNVRTDAIIAKIKSEKKPNERNDAIIDALNERFVKQHNNAYGVLETIYERNDSWQNVMSGMGITGRDRKEATSFAAEARVAETVCRNLFTYSGLAQTIAQLPTYDALRQWFTVDGDVENLVQNKMKILGAKYQLLRARVWARVYGGALVVMLIDDGGLLTDPLDWKNIKNIEGLKVFHRYRTARQTYYLDPSKANYWETETYFVNPPRGTGFSVHESRCLVFDGVDVPPEIRVGNVMWGDSVYQAIFQRLRGLGESYNNIEHIIGEFLLMVTKIKGLSQKIAEGKEAEVIKRAMTINMTRHLQNSYMLDADGEDATRISANTAGLRDLVETLMMGVSADCRIPVRRLFGSPIAGGMNNSGENEVRDYYDFVDAFEREQGILAPLEKLVKVIMLCKDGDFKGQELEGWKINFPPLWEEPLSVQIANKKLQAEVDEKYLSIGDDYGMVLSRDEVRRSRFANGHSFDTTLDEDVTEPTEKGGEDLAGMTQGI